MDHYRNAAGYVKLVYIGVASGTAGPVLAGPLFGP